MVLFMCGLCALPLADWLNSGESGGVREGCGHFHLLSHTLVSRELCCVVFV